MAEDGILGVLEDNGVDWDESVERIESIRVIVAEPEIDQLEKSSIDKKFSI